MTLPSRSASLLASLVLMTAGRAASPRTPQEQAQTFTSRVQGVIVDVEVTRAGRPVAGLTKRDFEVRDNGVLQDADVLNGTDAPVHAVLALDVSSSTAGSRLTDLVAAGRAFLSGLHPAAGDQAALTTFSHRVSLRSPLTSDLEAVRLALDRVQPSGDTALFDGIYTGLVTTQTVLGAALVVVYTDGSDTVSWLKASDVVDAARHVNAVVEAVVVRGGHRIDALKTIVDTTGGTIFTVDSTTGLASMFENILRDFRSRYVVTYMPRGVAPGGFHGLDVRVRGSSLKVHARRGYFSTAGNH